MRMFRKGNKMEPGSNPCSNISPFDKKNLPQIVDTVLPLWGAPEQDEAFNRIDVEFIVRNNIFENGLSMQITNPAKPTELFAAVFAARKTDKNDASIWLSAHSKNVSEKEQFSLDLVKTYLQKMDEKTLSFMNDEDIKLSLFVSRKKGFGRPLLEEFTKTLRKKGFKTMYLWTDCTCSWKWYPEHGFELVAEDIYEPFKENEKDFITYIYKKQIS